MTVGLQLITSIHHRLGSITPHGTNHSTVHSISNASMTSTQPYLNPLPTSLANLLQATNSKVPRATSLEQREPGPFPAILSPILRSTLTGYQNSNYPVIKQEQFDGTVMKQEYYGNEQMPHSTVGSLVEHRRLGPLDSLGRNKPKPPKPRPVS